MKDRQTESDVIKAIRILSARQVEAAGSGHPGTPLGAAPVMASANGALHFGVREHAMAAICNGIALHGDYAEEQSSMPEPGKAGVIFLPYIVCAFPESLNRKQICAKFMTGFM